MREFKSKAMKSRLERGIKKAKKLPIPSDGSMRNLIYETIPNGWHYQVEYIHDSRLCEKPYVAVYAFRPKGRWHARSADLCLTREI